MENLENFVNVLNGWCIFITWFSGGYRKGILAWNGLQQNLSQLSITPKLCFDKEEKVYKEENNFLHHAQGFSDVFRGI